MIAGVRDAFLDEGVDEQVLQEMKQVWTNKLLSSKAVEITPDASDAHPAPVLSNNSKVSIQMFPTFSYSIFSLFKYQSNGTKSKSRPSAAAQQAKKADAALAAEAAAAAAKDAAESNAAGTTATTTNTNTKQTNSNAQSQSSTNSQQPQSSQSAQQPPPLQHQSTSQQQQQQQAPPQGPQAVVANLHPSKIVPIQITLPPQPGVLNSEPRVLTIHVPASALQENQLHQVLTGPIITSIMSLPPQLASSVLQQHVNAWLQNQSLTLQKQMDGANDTSDDEASDVSDDNLDGDDDDDLDKEDDEEIDGEGGAEEEPLNTDDDVSEEEQADLFDTDNVIVCQYDKVIFNY